MHTVLTWLKFQILRKCESLSCTISKLRRVTESKTSTAVLWQTPMMYPL